MSVGDNIKKYRTSAGISQQTLADSLFISPQAVSKWERNECLPDSSLLPKIADELGVSLDRLFYREKIGILDIAYSISHAMKSLSETEKFRYIRQIAYIGEYSVFSSPEYILKKSQNGENRWDLYNCHRSACTEAEGGFTFDSNRRELPFFSIFPEPDDGWKSVLKPDERYCDFFELMSDRQVIKILFDLYEKPKGFSFDESYAEREWGSADISETLLKLEKLRVLRFEDTVVDGRRTGLWFFIPKGGLIALFAILNEYIFHGESYDLQSDSRESPYLK